MLGQVEQVVFYLVVGDYVPDAPVLVLVRHLVLHLHQRAQAELLVQVCVGVEDLVLVRIADFELVLQLLYRRDRFAALLGLVAGIHSRLVVLVEGYLSQRFTLFFLTAVRVGLLGVHVCVLDVVIFLDEGVEPVLDFIFWSPG